MAANVILFDRTKLPLSEALNAIITIREGRERLKRVRDAMIQFRNGADNGSDASNYALLTTQCGVSAGGYATANDATRAAFLELDSLLYKLTTNASVTDVLAAVDQACAKFGV